MFASASDRFDEAAHAFVGIRRSAAVALVLHDRGDLVEDSLGEAVVCRGLADGAVFETAYVLARRREGHPAR